MTTTDPKQAMRAFGYQVLPPSDPEDCNAWRMIPPSNGHTEYLAADEREGWEKAEQHWRGAALEKALASVVVIPADPKLIERASLIAEQAYSAGNLVTCDGYYEFDLDAAAAVIAAAINEAAQKAKEPRKQFPILGGNGAKIDWQLVVDHGRQARDNHYQSVERLAQRGGLGWCELYAVLHNRKWQRMDQNEAILACRALEARYLAAIEAKESQHGDA